MNFSLANSSDQLVFVFFSILVSLLIATFAFRSGFFALNRKENVKISFGEVLVAFCLYFVVTFFAIFIIKLFSLFVTFDYHSNIFFFLLIAIFQAIFLFYYSFGHWAEFFGISLLRSNFKKGIFLGIVAWLISFPLAIGLSKLSLLVLSHFGYLAVEQEVVNFVRISLSSPPLFVFLCIMIVIVVPCLEELLFRGFLQTFLMQILNRKWRILFTALIFSFFHFDFRYGLENLPLMVALFIFALFGGFLYEKQRSLFASITLHVMFNLANIVLLVLSG